MRSLICCGRPYYYPQLAHASCRTLLFHADVLFAAPGIPRRHAATSAGRTSSRCPHRQHARMDEPVAREYSRATWVRVLQSVQSRANTRSEEHTSELQSLRHLVCRLLLEKKKE